MTTGSLAKVATVLLLAGVFAGPVWAQSEQPLRLVPGGQSQTGQETPGSDAGTEAEDAGEPGIMIQDLGAVDPDSVGTIDAASGGLGLDMWANTPRSYIETLMRDFPSRIGSPAMRDLARRLLLSSAAIPQPEGAGPSESLIGLRVRTLMRMGLLDDAQALIAVAPRREEDTALLKAQVEAQLLEFDLAGACATAQSQAERLSEPFWQEILVFCQIIEGDVSGAQFAADLLSETNPDPDPVFYTLLDHLAGDPSAAVSSLNEPRPLQLAMMRTARLELPPDVLNNETPALLRTVGVSPNAPLALRLEAAEAAAQAGAITPSLLAEVYDSVPFLPTELDSPISAAEEEPGPRSRALLYRAAAVQDEAGALAALLERAFQLARQNKLYPLMIQVHQPNLARIEPTPDLWWFAVEAARAHYALGEPDRARLWIEMLRGEASKDPDAQRAADSLWALGRMTGEPESNETDAEAAWQTAMRAADAQGANFRISLAYVIFEALGEPVSQATWRELTRPDTFADTPVPDVALRRAMFAAAANGSRGETVLLALLTMGEHGPAATDPAVLSDLMVALVGVGLQADARALAMEAMIEAGL